MTRWEETVSHKAKVMLSKVGIRAGRGILVLLTRGGRITRKPGSACFSRLKINLHQRPAAASCIFMFIN